MSEAMDRWERQAIGGDPLRRGDSVGAEADQWKTPSNCEGWLARDIVVHVVGNYRGTAAQATGGQPTAVGADEDIVVAWADAVDLIRALAQDPAILATEVRGLAGPLPLEAMLGSVMAVDTHVHTWDLAKTFGANITLDLGLIVLTMNMLGPVDEMIRQPGVFAAKIEPPADADEQTKTLCFLGRQP
jgi:uncharacterized protein (TIGR03086 family)